MTSAEELRHRRLRVPRQDGTALIEPTLTELPRLVEKNVAATQLDGYSCHGRSLRDLSLEARRHLLTAAFDYSSNYRDVERPAANAATEPIVLTGHQPALFHPGVWFKNLALAEIGRRLKAPAVNLLIDNDICRDASIRVPSGSVADPHLETIAFDRATTAIPYEERRILDRPTFDSFGDRVRQTIAPLVADPLIEQLWPLARNAAESTNHLGQSLSSARHQLEGQLGVASTLEIPLSHICETLSFRWFAAHLLARLPQLWEIYNNGVETYRQVNRIRSRSHPVPNLSREDDFWEAPFWLWSRQEPQRRQLFARVARQHVELTDRAGLHLKLDLSSDGDASIASEQLANWTAEGVRLRPRALITTMYARMCLSDLFLHGIGGAKYDELTDLIIRQFFGLNPPGFMVLTATTLLPIPRDGWVNSADVRRAEQTLRELRFHPEKHVAVDSNAIRKLVANKKECVNSEPADFAERRKRHVEFTRIGDEFAAIVEPQRQEWLLRCANMVEARRRQAVLDSREFSYCLFPAEKMLATLLAFLKAST